MSTAPSASGPKLHAAKNPARSRRRPHADVEDLPVPELIREALHEFASQAPCAVTRMDHDDVHRGDHGSVRRRVREPHEGFPLDVALPGEHVEAHGPYPRQTSVARAVVTPRPFRFVGVDPGEGAYHARFLRGEHPRQLARQPVVTGAAEQRGGARRVDVLGLAREGQAPERSGRARPARGVGHHRRAAGRRRSARSVRGGVAEVEGFRGGRDGRRRPGTHRAPLVDATGESVTRERHASGGGGDGSGRVAIGLWRADARSFAVDYSDSGGLAARAGFDRRRDLEKRFVSEKLS